MAVESHLVQLRRKHAVLEAKIEGWEKTHNPALWPDIQRGKREKLRLKDEIAALAKGVTIH